MLSSIEMPLVGAPSVGIIRRDVKGLQQLFEIEKALVIAPS
jgi:hypothetical protein